MGDKIEGKIGRNWELSQLGDGATRSRIEDGWHPSSEQEERKREEEGGLKFETTPW